MQGCLLASAKVAILATPLRCWRHLLRSKLSPVGEVVLGATLDVVICCRSEPSSPERPGGVSRTREWSLHGGAAVTRMM